MYKKSEAGDELWCAGVYSGRSPGVAFNTTCYYHTLSKATARCESSQQGNPSEEENREKWDQSTKEAQRQQPLDVWFLSCKILRLQSLTSDWLQYDMFIHRGNMWILLKLWGECWGGPALPLSVCHPVLPLHPFTTWSTWQLGPAGRTGLMAQRNSTLAWTEAYRPPPAHVLTQMVVFLLCSHSYNTHLSVTRWGDRFYFD